MFRIGEFSKLTQVSIRMLRYYDETGLLKPAETDAATQYRLYSAAQIPQLNRIVFLRDLGFTVADILDALHQWEDGLLHERLEAKRRVIEQTIRAEQEKLLKIELAQRDIKQEKLSLHCSVCVKSVPGCLVLSLRRRVPDYYAEGGLWRELTEFSLRQGVAVSEHSFTIYHDTDYRDKDVDIELCTPVSGNVEGDGKDRDGIGYRYVEPVPEMASVMVHGGFERIGSAFLAIADWLQQHNQYRMLGPNRQIVHRGPWNEADPKHYLIEIQIPLEHIRR